MKPSLLIALATAVPALVAQAPAATPLDAAAIQKLSQTAYQAVRADISAQRKRGVEVKDLDYRLDTHLKALREGLAKAQGTEKEAYRIAEWATLLNFSRNEGSLQDLGKTLLKEIAPTSPAWEVAPTLVPYLPQVQGETGKAYLEQIQAQGAPGVRASLKASELEALLEEGDLKAVEALVADLERAFPGTAATRKAVDTVAQAKARGLFKGQQAPDFSLQDLDHPGKTLTKATFKGKYLLVDFWATWCGWCVKELPETHQLHTQYKAKGLEILSLSADRKPEDVASFRKRPGLAMPWHHAYIGIGETSHPIQEAYQVNGFPTLYLIAPDGTIAARGSELRGEALAKTLARILK